MTHILYIIIIIITGLVSSLVTMYLPALKQRYKRITTRREDNMRRMVKEEVEAAIKQILND
jgi:competence protein ComGC